MNTPVDNRLWGATILSCQQVSSPSGEEPSAKFTLSLPLCAARRLTSFEIPCGLSVRFPLRHRTFFLIHRNSETFLQVLSSGKMQSSQ